MATPNKKKEPAKTDTTSPDPEKDTGNPPKPVEAKSWMPGQLNDISPPRIPRTIGQGGGDILQQMTHMLKHFNTFDAFANTGPYVGVVVRDETDWWNGTSQSEVGEEGEPYKTPDNPELGRASVLGQNTRLTYLRVRIPEVHAAIPMPKETGTEADEESMKIMDMFDVFAAKSDDQEKYPQLKAGSLVWVDYGNKTNWTDPVYLGPVQEGEGGSTGKPPDSKKKHDTPCKGQYKRRPASGDKLAGSNVVLTPHQGLPRLSRKRLDRMKATGKPIESYKFTGDALKTKPWNLVGTPNEKVVQFKEIKKAYKDASQWHMKLWFGHLPSNGPQDKKHTPHQRHTVIIAPMYFEPNEPFEIIYWFHGLTGFKTKNFKSRYFPQMNKLQEDGRNFVMVIPELPWSERGTGTTGGVRQRLGWMKSKKNGAGGNFEQFHKESLGVIDKHIGKFPTNPVAFISAYGHSNGGSALAQAAKTGALTAVKPDRIFFSDSDYGWGYGGGKGAVYEVWNSYIKNSKKKIWMTVLTMDSSRTDGGPRKQARDFFNKDTNAEDRKKHFIYNIEVNKPANKKKWAAKVAGAPQGTQIIKQKYSGDLHSWCGENALTLTHPDHIKSMQLAEKEAAAKAKEKAEKIAQSSDPAKQAEAEEQKGAAADSKDIKENKEGTSQESKAPVPPKAEGPVNAKPKPANPPAPASGAEKGSTTQKGDPPKPNFKKSPAVKWDENRVKHKEYGSMKSDSKNLVKIEGNKKAHVLVVSRYKAMKAAAAKDGVTMKIHSAWRKHAWKSFEDYKAQMIKEYGSLAKGKKYKAYQSPHETGLALDIVGHGMKVDSDQYGTRKETLKKHRETKLGKWLINNAHKFGFTPYKSETWHWELRLPIEAYTSGKEFTDNFAVRVNDIGKAHNPNLGGGGGGAKGSGTKAAPCVRAGSSGGQPPGNDPGIQVAVGAAAKGLGKDLVLGPPGLRWREGNDMHNKWRRLITGFCIHETAGWPTSIHERKIRQKRGECAIHFWNTSDGKIMQTIHPSARMGHAQRISGTTCGTEMTTQGPLAPQYWKYAAGYMKFGYHFIGNPSVKGIKGKYDIAAYPGCGGQGRIMMLPTPKQLEAVWRLIMSLKKNPPDVTGKYQMHGGKKHACKFDMHIAFPAVSKSLGVFTWTRWAGRPVASNEPESVSQDYWHKTGVKGIVCHWDGGYHADGKMGVYYCLARAKGFSPKDAFYALVGAVTTGKKDGKHAPKFARYSEFPSKKMVSKGKAKYPFPYNQKFWTDMGPGALSWNRNKKKHKTRIKWDEYVAQNPKIIGNPEKPV